MKSSTSGVFSRTRLSALKSRYNKANEAFDKIFQRQVILAFIHGYVAAAVVTAENMDDERKAAQGRALVVEMTTIQAKVDDNFANEAPPAQKELSQVEGLVEQLKKLGVSEGFDHPGQGGGAAKVDPLPGTISTRLDSIDCLFESLIAAMKKVVKSAEIARKQVTEKDQEGARASIEGTLKPGVWEIFGICTKVSEHLKGIKGMLEEKQSAEEEVIAVTQASETEGGGSAPADASDSDTDSYAAELESSLGEETDPDLERALALSMGPST